jgi:hypothetical protein
MNPPKCDGSVSWTLFHDSLKPWLIKKVGQAVRSRIYLPFFRADILLSAPALVTYEGIGGALKGRYGDHTLAAD